MRISKFPICFVGAVRKFAQKDKPLWTCLQPWFLFFKFCGLETLAIFPIIWVLFSKLHFKKISNFLQFSFFPATVPNIHQNSNKFTGLDPILLICYFGLGDIGEEKKICNSQCFYFHICDIEIFGESFPLNSQIGWNYTGKWHSSKISQKTIYRQKSENSLFLFLKWGK